GLIVAACHLTTTPNSTLPLPFETGQQLRSKHTQSMWYTSGEADIPFFTTYCTTITRLYDTNVFIPLYPVCPLCLPVYDAVLFCLRQESKSRPASRQNPTGFTDHRHLECQKRHRYPRL